MTLVLHDLSDDEALTALTQASSWEAPQALGYHHDQYQQLLTTVIGDRLHCLVVERPGYGVRAVLPYRSILSRHGMVLNALPFFGCNGLVLSCSGDAVAEELLLSGFRRRAMCPGVFSATLYSPFLINPSPWIDSLQADEVVVKFTQFLDLSGDVRWPAKRLADLRRAANRGFTIRRGQSSDAAKVTAIHEDNCRLLRISAKPRTFIEGTFALAESNPNSPLRWLVAEREGAVVAALLYGQGPCTGSYILPCATVDERPFQPNALLLDAAIHDGHQGGMLYWNFESSPAWGDPVFKYKEGWGARIAPYALFTFYGNRAQRPTQNDIATVRSECPYYFVAPMDAMGGLYPPHVALDQAYAGLAPYLAANANLT